MDNKYTAPTVLLRCRTYGAIMIPHLRCYYDIAPMEQEKIKNVTTGCHHNNPIGVTS